jgi:hypothetical protein
MTRRMIGLLSTLTLSLLVASLAAVAQPAGKVSRLGLLLTFRTLCPESWMVLRVAPHINPRLAIHAAC